MSQPIPKRNIEGSHEQITMLNRSLGLTDVFLSFSKCRLPSYMSAAIVQVQHATVRIWHKVLGTRSSRGLVSSEEAGVGMSLATRCSLIWMSLISYRGAPPEFVVTNWRSAHVRQWFGMRSHRTMEQYIGRFTFL